MGAIIGFVVRLVGYALLIGLPVRIAEYFWVRASLDQVDALRPSHDVVAVGVTIAPFLLAVFGYGALRNTAVFIALFIAGAALTAPFALARFAAAG
jgi:xanthine/uracil permease